MTSHAIVPERRTLHGTFSRDFAPVLTIESGDTVVYRTLDAGWGIGPWEGEGNPWDNEEANRKRKFAPRHPETDAGHALCGPIAIRGAEPGMTLEVQIGDIVPGTWGWTAAGGWDSPFNRALNLADKPGVHHRWEVHAGRGVATNQHGHTVRLRPFMGVLGMPPDTPGIHSTAPPRATGGNLDCKELTAGTTLYLPIAVAGGLFSVGDGHGTQGDGESSGTAIECPMERVELTFALRPDLALKTPRARTTEGWLTFGLDEDLNQAAYKALDAMLDLMSERHALPRADALALASLVVDLRVTQIVNGVQGVHAVLPHNAIETRQAG